MDTPSANAIIARNVAASQDMNSIREWWGLTIANMDQHSAAIMACYQNEFPAELEPYMACWLRMSDAAREVARTFCDPPWVAARQSVESREMPPGTET